MGEWSGEIVTPGALTGELGRYLQYRVSLESSDPAFSPVLTELSFDWSVTGCDSGHGAGEGLGIWTGSHAHREVTLTTGQWLALARATPDRPEEDEPQLAL